MSCIITNSMAYSMRPAWCVLGTWPSLIPLLRPLFVLGALATSDQWINPALCILNVRGTLWDLWNGFDSGLMLEPAEALLSVTAQHKHLLISKMVTPCTNRPLTREKARIQHFHLKADFLWRICCSVSFCIWFLEQSMDHSLYRKYQYGWTRELDHKAELLGSSLLEGNSKG